MKRKAYKENFYIERMISEGGIGPELSYLLNKERRADEEVEETRELVPH